MAEIARTGNDDADDRVKAYYDELDALTAQAIEGEVDQTTFEQEMERIVIAFILLMFILGGGDLTNPDAAAELETKRQQQIASIAILAGDIYNGRYAERSKEAARKGLPEQTAHEGRDKLLNRLILWTFAASSVFSTGQKWQPPRYNPATGQVEDPAYMWVYGDTKHCTDCEGLNGVVLTAEEWRQSGIQPQSPDLECGGWNCQCQWIPTDSFSQGLGSVRL